MSSPNPLPEELAQFFRDVVLVLGGVFAVRGTDDETICQVARGLERVYRRAHARGVSAAGAPATSGSASPHPAILGLLHLTDGEETSA